MDSDNSSDYGSDVEILSFRTCAEFLALNLTLEDVANQDSLGLTSYPTRDVAMDSCGNRPWNMTVVQHHPSRLSVLIAYPICLLICTLGNILTFTVLARESTKSVKRIYLMSLACSDFIYMWSQLFDYLTNFETILKVNSTNQFINKISGVETFFQEMFITSSDWILVAFSIERFFAVVYPLYYNIFVSKKRAKLCVGIIFILAALYAMYNPIDYYWFYFNEDKRCPPSLNIPPRYMVNWHAVYEWSVIVVPVLTFLIILTVNCAVGVHLMRHKKFREHHALGSNIPDQLKDNQAIHMLLACAVMYVVTQLPGFVWNILNIVRHYPMCKIKLTENDTAIFNSVSGVTTNINYSCNFILYYGISTSFRQGLRELRRDFQSHRSCCSRTGDFWRKIAGMEVVGRPTTPYYVTGGLDKPPNRPSLESCMSNATTTSRASETPVPEHDTDNENSFHFSARRMS